jgi:mannose-6-phosphate isomerase-like protein (cupin superfamily)
MKHLRTGRVRSKFRVLATTRSAQAAMMTLPPGKSTGDAPENEHPRAEQWLFVVAGTGRAVVGKRRATIREGSLLLIEKGEPHWITNGGRKPLVTLNLYAPPAYGKGDEVLPRARK